MLYMGDDVLNIVDVHESRHEGSMGGKRPSWSFAYADASGPATARRCVYTVRMSETLPRADQLSSCGIGKVAFPTIAEKFTCLTCKSKILVRLAKNALANACAVGLGKGKYSSGMMMVFGPGTFGPS